MKTKHSIASKGVKNFLSISIAVSFALTLFSIQTSYAQYCAVKKYYSALNSGNFDAFKAGVKKYSTKHPTDVAVYYARARYFFDEENPSYNIDSAKHYINQSIKAFDSPLKKRQQKIYSSLGIRLPRAKYLDKIINAFAFNRASGTNTVEGYNFFINNYTDAGQRNDAVARRNKLAFEQAKDKYDLSSFEQFMKKYPEASEAGEAHSLYEELLYRSKTSDSTYQSYFNFMQQYPNSPHFNEAKKNYERILYRERTRDRQLSSYISFHNDYPSSPYTTEVQDSIYSLSTKVATKNNFEAYIKTYPGSTHIGDAWTKYFQLSLIPYCDSTIRSFKSNYPLFPYPGIIDKEDMSLIITLKNIETDGLYGFVDSATGKLVVQVQFDDVNNFSEGLVAVDKYTKGTALFGYLNKYGEVKIPYAFPYAEDFKNGYAVVGNGNCDKDSCKYGIINRIGYLVLPMVYDEVSPFVEGRSLVKKDSLYGFINTDFKTVVPFRYSDAYPYTNGLAAVKNDTGWIFIDKNGQQPFKQYYIKAYSFSEGLAAVEDKNELWGYMDTKGNWAIKPKYQQAESFKDGKAKVFVPVPKKKKNAIKLPKEMYIDKNGNFVSQ